MAEQKELTHWKKNNDSRYISGEDLKSALHGLRPEMSVVIEKFEDSETFDQNSQTKAVKTGFFLKEVNGKPLYKPVILNNTIAKFCVKEFGSEFMENWINKPFTIYAKPDTRFGYVARFKKYIAPATVKPDNALKLLSAATTLDELAKTWTALTAEEKLLPEVMSKKESLKTTLK